MELIAAFTGVLSVYFASNLNKWTWGAGIISSCLLVYLFYNAELYANSGLHILFIISSIWGLFLWNKEVVTLDVSFDDINIETGVLFVIIDNIVPNTLDALSVSFALTATLLLAIKDSSCWAYYIASNLISVYLCYDAELYMLGVQYIIYITLSIYGYVKWTSSWEISPVS
jgi:nicotinamide mononucleotide transporter